MGHTESDDDDRLYSHLLTLMSVASAMVGVCLTAIGLISIFKAISKVEATADDLLAIGALLFTVVTLLSFLGIRTRIRMTWPHYLLVMDILFCLGILATLAASLMLTWLMI